MNSLGTVSHELFLMFQNGSGTPVQEQNFAGEMIQAEKKKKKMPYST